MTMITDGTGSGNRVKVSSENRMYVDSITETSYEHAAEEGEAFNINTGDIEIGAIDGDQALLYVKNNEDQTLEIVGWFIGIRDADRGVATSDTNIFQLYANPTGGTLLSAGNDGAVVNRNLGSPRQFDIDVKVATGGAMTITGYETPSLLYQYHTAGRTFGTVNFTLTKGASLGIVVNSKGADMTLYTGFTGYLADDD